MKIMHSKKDNIEVKIYDKVDEFIEKSFESYSWVQGSMNGSDFIFDCVTILYYKCHNVSLKHG